MTDDDQDAMPGQVRMAAPADRYSPQVQAMAETVHDAVYEALRAGAAPNEVISCLVSLTVASDHEICRELGATSAMAKVLRGVAAKIDSGELAALMTGAGGRA